MIKVKLERLDHPLSKQWGGTEGLKEVNYAIRFMFSQDHSLLPLTSLHPHLLTFIWVKTSLSPQSHVSEWLLLY